MEDKDQRIIELEAMVAVLKNQLHSAIDAACTGHAQVIVLQSRIAELQRHSEKQE